MTQKRTHLLAWFTLFPILITLVTELNKSQIIWRFRIVDLVDLVVLAPFYGVVLYALITIDTPSGLPTKASVGCLILFLYGHAMHVTANTINTYLTEVRDYREIVPDDAYDLIYFLDEDLSHLLIFGGLLALLMIMCAYEVRADAANPLWPVTVLGVIEGATLAIAMIEAAKPYLPFASAIVSLAVLTHFNQGIWPQTPLSRYTLWMALGLLVTPVAYVLVFGSLTQPSELWSVPLK